MDSGLIRKPLFASYGNEEIRENLAADRQIKMTYTESQLLTDPLQQVLSKWAFKFVERFGLYCLKQPRFIELRPSYLYNF